MYDDPRAYPVEQIALAPLRPGLAEALHILLQAHGASVEEHADGCIMRFPAGTTRRRKLPFVLTEREEIVLPDGYLLLYETGRDGQRNVRVDPRDLPAELVAAFQKDDEERERARTRARAARAQYL